MNYYQFHISDWALHTSHLTLEEEAVYRRLLDYYYDTEGPIPEKTQSVIRRLRLGSYAETVGLILAEFFVLEADGWHNLRADIEISDYQKKAERARSNGKKGGRPKKQTQQSRGVKTQPVISGNPEQTQEEPDSNPEKTGSKANQEPRTINQEPLTSNNPPIPPDGEKGSRAADAREVFSFWCTHFSKRANTTFTGKRKTAVEKRLAEGYTVDDLKQAVVGCSRTPHNMGHNDRDEVYDDLELICRDPQHVDRFMRNANRVTRQEQQQQDLQAWLNEGHEPQGHAEPGYIDGELEHEPF